MREAVTADSVESVCTTVMGSARWESSAGDDVAVLALGRRYSGEIGAVADVNA